MGSEFEDESLKTNKSRLCLSFSDRSAFLGSKKKTKTKPQTKQAK